MAAAAGFIAATVVFKGKEILEKYKEKAQKEQPAEKEKSAE